MKFVVTKSLIICVLFLTGCGSEGNSRFIQNLIVADAEVEDVNRVDDDPFDVLRPLLGRVNFRYRFFDSTDAEFSRTVVFSSANFIALESGNFVIGALNTAGDPTVCAYTLVPNHPYACGVEYLDGSLDYFLFSDISGSIAAGNYEFCGPGEPDCATYDDSGSQLLLNPDGTVDVTVTRLTAFTADDQQDRGFDQSSALHDLDFKLYYEQFTQMSPLPRTSGSSADTAINDAFETIREILKEID